VAMGKYFSDIKGQNSAVRILSAQLESDSLSHAYIFLGAEGTGKEYLAHEFAKYILCQGSPEDSCDSCVRFNHGSHPDFIYINGRSGIKIDMVREAIERVNLSPNLSEYKVLLFTKAENLGIEAANALLKTFEEPPRDCIIILTAISEKSLPPTIVSRGQKIKFANLSKKDIQEILNKEFPNSDIEKVLEYAGGSIGKAKLMLEKPEKYENEAQIHGDIGKMVNTPSVIEKFNIIDFYDKEKKLREFFDIFAQSVFLAIDFRIKGEGEGKDSGPLNGLALDNLASLGHKILKIYEDLEYNINLKLAIEEAILDNLIVRDLKG
jgi:DNA polymerase-3 subunit delta'